MILRRLFRGAEAERPGLPPPRPERRTYAVGDLHGRLDLCEAMLSAITADAGGAEHDLVFLGDYVDRGPDSAPVLRRLQGLGRDAQRIVCLMGNHDRMLLDFLRDPVADPVWLGVGAQETLASFGVPPVRAGDTPDDAERRVRAAAELAAAMGDDLRGWLAARPLWWRSGDLVAVHALTDPGLSMEDQAEETLLWARPTPGLPPRADGAWVVHGHTVMPEPRVRAGHVAVDTGAWRSGRLTAAVFTPGGDPPRFLQVSAEIG